MKWIVALGIIISLISSGHSLAQTDQSDEVEKLLAGIESTSQTHRINAAKTISISGLQDHGLYEKIAEIIKAGYKLPYERDHAEEMAWMCKALAASGDPKYRQLLDEVSQNSPSSKVRRHAKQSAKLIEQYAERNKVLNKSDSWDEELTDEENRLVNMLRSDDVSLRRDAAKIIVGNVKTNEKVFPAVASTLKDMSETFRSDSLSVDTMAWLCKALAASGDSKYIADLEFVRNNTQSVKLRKYTAEAIKALK
jgi:hypothetical protein